MSFDVEHTDDMPNNNKSLLAVHSDISGANSRYVL